MSQGESHEEVGHTVNTHTNTDTHTCFRKATGKLQTHNSLLCLLGENTHRHYPTQTQECVYVYSRHTHKQSLCVCVCGDVFVVGLSVKHKPRHTSRRLIFRTVLSVSAQTCYQTKPHTVCCRAHTDTHTH